MRYLLVVPLCLALLAGCDVVVNTTSAPQPTPTAVSGESAGLTGESESDVPGAAQTEGALKTLVTYLAFFAEMCGALVIGVATVREFIRYVPHIFGRDRPGEDYQEELRLRLGRSLALALEFELGADILRTAVAPTLRVIGVVAAIVVLRTLLNYFLERELRQVEQRRERQVTEGVTGS